MTVKRTEKARKSPLPPPARRALVLARSEPRFAPVQTARFVSAKTVGSFVPTLTKKAFEKFGFSTATLITDWARIAGADLAACTAPEKLKWPRGGEGVVSEDDENDEAERRGATLILRVDPARALDVEYKARQITDRINAYFGYRAVDTIRLVQAPLERAARSAPAPQPQKREATGDDPLMAALARLEQGVRRRQPVRA